VSTLGQLSYECVDGPLQLFDVGKMPVRNFEYWINLSGNVKRSANLIEGPARDPQKMRKFLARTPTVAFTNIERYGQ
jgi:hypothetical protein